MYCRCYTKGKTRDTLSLNTMNYAHLLPLRVIGMPSFSDLKK